MWRTTNVYYHGDQRSLLLQAISPLLEVLRPTVPACYFVTHWLRGPHVAINIDTSDETAEGVVAPAIEEIVGGYLQRRPSEVAINSDALLALHTRLAELEHEPGPLTPLAPDNSFEETPYRYRTKILGSVEASELLAEFYVATTPMAFDALEQCPSGPEIISLSFDLMTATAHTLSGVGLERGFVSFRSHAEAFLSWWPEADGLRERWDNYYAVHKNPIKRRITAILNAEDRGAQSEPLLSEWFRSTRTISRKGRDHITSGTISMDPPWASESPDSDEVAAEMIGKSSFHSHRRPEGHAVNKNWFDHYRLMLNYTYLQMTRLGVKPAERFFLCHIIANAAEDMFSTSALEVNLPRPDETVVYG